MQKEDCAETNKNAQCSILRQLGKQGMVPGAEEGLSKQGWMNQCVKKEWNVTSHVDIFTKKEEYLS